jgi:hypothetical protein
MRQTQLNVAGLVLIGSASLRRRQFKSRKLLNSYCAGAHCDLVIHDVSALFSEQDGDPSHSPHPRGDFWPKTCEFLEKPAHFKISQRILG